MIQEFARAAIAEIDLEFLPHILAISELLDVEPNLRPSFGRSRPVPFNSPEYWSLLSNKFVNGREIQLPSAPRTFADPIVSIILTQYFSLPMERLDEVAREHKLSMAAENCIGSFLELYLSTILEPLGWIWCAGSTVKSTDFIRKANGSWSLLQVKNRSNSENSSSAAIREGTDIKKWFRSFANRDATNWDHFPDPVAQRQLSEDGFRAFMNTLLQ